MQESCEKILKNARIEKNLQITKAACDLNVSERKLKLYESGEPKGKDKLLYRDAMMYYNDAHVGAAYLNDDEVYTSLFGKIAMTDKLTAAVQYTIERDSESHVDEILRWGLSEGETLLDKTLKRIRALYDTLTNLLLNNFTRPHGYAY